MKRYGNPESGITAYEIHEDRILVEFRGSDVYVYSYTSAGRRHIEAMKKLAAAGRGLNTYISQHHVRYE